MCCYLLGEIDDFEHLHRLIQSMHGTEAYFLEDIRKSRSILLVANRTKLRHYHGRLNCNVCLLQLAP